MEELREDKYHARCRECGFVKANYLFTPGELRKSEKRPLCRKCVKKKNETMLANPGAPVGYGVRGRGW